MVSCDHAGTAGQMYCRDDLMQALIDGFDCRDRRRDHAGVADHVGVCEVDYREARVLGGECRLERIGYSVRAHLRFEVVGGDVALRWDQLPALPGEGVLLPTVEEVGDVGVFLGLRHVQLLHSRP